MKVSTKKLIINEANKKLGEHEGSHVDKIKDLLRITLDYCDQQGVFIKEAEVFNSLSSLNIGYQFLYRQSKTPTSASEGVLSVRHLGRNTFSITLDSRLVSLLQVTEALSDTFTDTNNLRDAASVKECKKDQRVLALVKGSLGGDPITCGKYISEINDTIAELKNNLPEYQLRSEIVDLERAKLSEKLDHLRKQVADVEKELKSL